MNSTEMVGAGVARRPRRRFGLPDKGTYIVLALILSLGMFLISPVLVILTLSFNTSPNFFIGAREWGLGNWTTAFQTPGLWTALFNTVWLWVLSATVAFPIAVTIAWFLARTKIPHSHALEFLFWISYVTPGGLVAWIMLFDPNIGLANVGLEALPFISNGPFNIFSIEGIIFVNIIGSGISLKVMLLTPAFRNMDSAMEEAARVGGASNVRTLMRVTVPMMISPIALIFALQLMRMFNSFENELILGLPIGFYVYSTMIYDQVRLHEPPLYGNATALAGITLLLVALIIPLQRWILQRRRYTTITGNFKPGLISLGPWAWIAFGGIVFYHSFTTFLPLLVMLGGSFMTRTGYFILDPIWTMDHWKFVFDNAVFYTALRTTLILSFTTAIVSPILFAVIAYILVRTKWRFRFGLDSTIWVSAAIPGMLSSLGLLLGVPLDAGAGHHLRDNLGAPHRHRAPGQHDRREHHEGNAGAGRFRHGGGRPYLGGRLGQDLLQDLDPAAVPHAGPAGALQLHDSGRHDRQHHSAGLTRNDNGLDPGARMADARRPLAGRGGSRPDHPGVYHPDRGVRRAALRHYAGSAPSVGAWGWPSHIVEGVASSPSGLLTATMRLAPPSRLDFSPKRGELRRGSPPAPMGRE